MFILFNALCFHQYGPHQTAANSLLVKEHFVCAIAGSLLHLTERVFPDECYVALTGRASRMDYQQAIQQ
jgi:hypothetical protein